MTSDTLAIVLAFVTGVLLGAMFFGGLWWTVQKGVASQWPIAWFFGSLVLRTGIVLAGFYFVTRGHWERLMMCLAGFLIARVLVVKRLARAPAEEPDQLARETRHASQSR